LEDKAMSEIVAAVYDSEDTVTNAYDDLISTGIPSEKIRIDKDKRQIQVMTPDTSEPEIVEILGRHKPVKLDT
jgi:hypothetical protein